MGVTVGSDRPGDLGTPGEHGGSTQECWLPNGAPQPQKGCLEDTKGGKVAPGAHCHTNTGRDPPGHRALAAPSTPLRFEGSLPAKTEPPEGGAGAALRPARLGTARGGSSKPRGGGHPPPWGPGSLSEDDPPDASA